MRIVLIISLAAAALAESTSSSTLDSASPVAAVHGQDVGSVKTKHLRSGVLDEDRLFNFPAVTDSLQSLTNKLKVDKLLHSVGYQTSAAKMFDRMNRKAVARDDYFTSHDFILYHKAVTIEVKRGSPNKAMLAVLLPLHENKAELARKLEAASRTEAQKWNAALEKGNVDVIERKEARGLLNTLMRDWVKESKSMDDIFAQSLRLGAKSEDEVAKWDLAVLTKFVKLYNNDKPEERKTLLKKLPLLYEGVDVLKQIKRPHEPNPMLDRLERILFPMWLAQQKKPEDVMTLLNVQYSVSEFSAASRLSNRYKVVYKHLEPHLKTVKKS